MTDVFLVTGTDRITGKERRFFVRGRSDEVARAFAAQRNIIAISVEMVDPTEVPAGVPILRAGADDIRRAAKGPAIIERPILTIALGVFAGLVMFWLFFALMMLVFGSAVSIIE